MTYETLEMAIMKIWKERGLDVERIQFQVAPLDRDGSLFEWTIHARRKKEVKKND